MELYMRSKGFLCSVAENPHSLSGTFAHSQNEEGCVICDKDKTLNIPPHHVHFLDRVSNSTDPIFIGTGLDPGNVITHSYNKLNWGEHPKNLPNYAKDYLDKPLDEIVYDVGSLLYIISKGGYYAYDYVDEDSAKTELARSISGIKKKLYLAKSCYTTEDAYMVFTDKEKETIALCAKGFGERVNRSLKGAVEPLVNKKSFPLGSLPEM